MKEIIFQEMSNEQYTENFKAAVAHQGKEMTTDQMEILAEVIEQARLDAMNPVDLADNLVQNFQAIFN